MKLWASLILSMRSWSFACLASFSMSASTLVPAGTQLLADGLACAMLILLIGHPRGPGGPGKEASRVDTLGVVSPAAESQAVRSGGFRECLAGADPQPTPSPAAAEPGQGSGCQFRRSSPVNI